jgi:hypothetical protein
MMRGASGDLEGDLEMESRRDDSAAFLGDDPAGSGAMVPMVVGPDQLVGHLLLFGRQAGI